MEKIFIIKFVLSKVTMTMIIMTITMTLTMKQKGIETF